MHRCIAGLAAWAALVIVFAIVFAILLRHAENQGPWPLAALTSMVVAAVLVGLWRAEEEKLSAFRPLTARGAAVTMPRWPRATG
jgi:hypothetical protein